MPTCPFGWFTAFNNPNPPCHRQTDKKELNAFLFCGKIRQSYPNKIGFRDASGKKAAVYFERH